jgi:hypothetical protein
MRPRCEREHPLLLPRLQVCAGGPGASISRRRKLLSASSYGSYGGASTVAAGNRFALDFARTLNWFGPSSRCKFRSLCSLAMMEHLRTGVCACG